MSKTHRMILALAVFAMCVSGCFLARNKSTPAATLPEASANSGVEQPAERAIGPKETHCEQLAQAPPGLEELRMKKDGTIETRQWTLDERGSSPRWAIVRAKNQPRDGWAPKPGIAKLDFEPPLQPSLVPGLNQFLAYAQIDSESYDDNTIGTLNEVFGGARGQFKWRGRTYGYALTRELPCYPVLQ